MDRFGYGFWEACIRWLGYLHLPSKRLSEVSYVMLFLKVIKQLQCRIPPPPFPSFPLLPFPSPSHLSSLLFLNHEYLLQIK